MTHSESLAVYSAVATVVYLSVLIASAAVFAMQLRTYRRTRHASLRPLLMSTSLAFCHALLSAATQHYWQSSPLGFSLFLANVPVGLLQLGLGVHGTARLLQAFERQFPAHRPPTT